MSVSAASDASNTTLSPLGHTWVFDLDGTLVKHNGHLTPQGDALLQGAADFFRGIRPEDMVVIITSRTEEHRSETEAFLVKAGIRYDAIVFGAPFGERILVNDRKPSGLRCALAVNTERNRFMEQSFTIDESI